MSFCLDTSFLVDVLRGHPDAVRRFEDLCRAGPPSVTPISLSFLYLGAAKSRDPSRAIEAVERLLPQLRFLPFRLTACRIFGELVARLTREGRYIESEDAMIAAMALDHGESVVTRDLRHFSRIGGLRVESY